MHEHDVCALVQGQPSS